MNNGSNAKMLITIGIIMMLVIGYIGYSNVKKNNNYKENGKEVNCVVTSIIHGRKNRQTVDGEYIDDSGNIVTAKVIRNEPAVVGEEFTGLVVPEKPDEVYCMPKESTLKIIYGVLGGLELTGFVLIICGIVSAIRHRRSYY